MLVTILAAGGVAVVRARSGPPEVVPALGGPDRAGAFEGPAVAEPRPRWRHPVGARGGGAWGMHVPAVLGDHVFVATEGGLHAVDRTSGEVRWRTVAVDHPAGAPVAAEGVIVVPGHDRIVGVDASSGDVEWQTRMGGGGHWMLTSDGRHTIVALQYGLPNGAGAVVFDARSGERSYAVTLGDVVGVGDVVPRAVIADDTLLLSSPAGWGSGTLQAHDLGSGRLRWSQDVLGEVAVGDSLAVVVAAGSRPDRLAAARLSRHSLTAYDIVSGEVRWSRPVVTATGVTTVVDGDAVFATDRGELVAVDPRDGSTRWRASGVEQVLAAGGGLVIGRRGTRTLALSSDDGHPVWQADVEAVQAMVDGRDVVVRGPTAAASLDRQSGEVRWSFGGGQGGCTTAATGGDVIVATGDTVARLGADGTERWRTARGPADLDTELSLAVDPSTALVAWTTWSQAGPQGTVEALDPSTGQVRWRYVTRSAEWVGQPVFVDDAVLVPTAEASTGRTRLTMLDAADGAVRWETESGRASGVLAAYAVDERLGVRSTDDGRIEAFDLGTGRVRWATRSFSRTWTVPVVADEAAIVGAENGVAAYELATGERRWSVGVHGDPRGTGFAAADGVVVAGDGSSLVTIDLDSGEVRDTVALTGPVHGGIALAAGVAHVATRRGLETVDLGRGQRVTAIATDRLVVAPPLLFDGRMAVCLEGGTIAVYD